MPMRLKLVFFMTVCVWSAVSLAAGLPRYYPDSFPFRGKIDHIDPVERLVVIDDWTYMLSDRVVTHTRSREFDTTDKLGPGTSIGFRVVDPASRRPLITEIWVVPASTIY